jgi:hypothetical protein
MKDFSYSVYKSFVNYIDSDSIDVKPEHVLQLLELSHIYCEEELKQTLEQNLIEFINSENVSDLYLSALKYRFIELEIVCCTFIVKTFLMSAKLMNSIEWIIIFVKVLKVKHSNMENTIPNV